MGSPLFNQPAYSSQVPISWISSPQLQNSPPMAHFFFHVHLVLCLKKDNPLRKTVLKQKTKKRRRDAAVFARLPSSPLFEGFLGGFQPADPSRDRSRLQLHGVLVLIFLEGRTRAAAGSWEENQKRRGKPTWFFFGVCFLFVCVCLFCLVCPKRSF